MKDSSPPKVSNTLSITPTPLTSTVSNSEVNLLYTPTNPPQALQPGKTYEYTIRNNDFKLGPYTFFVPYKFIDDKYSTQIATQSIIFFGDFDS
jgi:hypothetical protein